MMVTGTIILCVYAVATIGLACYGLTRAAIGMSIVGMLLFTLWCCLAVGGDYDDRADEEWADWMAGRDE